MHPIGISPDDVSHYGVLANGGHAFFTADGGGLWATDGTPAGTTRIADVAPGGTGAVTELAPVGAKLYFVADDGVGGAELWATDGTAAGTGRVADLNPGPGSSLAAGLTPFGGGVAFTAYTPGGGVEV